LRWLEIILRFGGGVGKSQASFNIKNGGHAFPAACLAFACPKHSRTTNELHGGSLKGVKLSNFMVEVAGDHSEIWRWGEQKPDKLH